MRAHEPVEGFDPERTRPDEGTPASALVAGRLGRGDILAGKYRLEMLLGEGGMGFVWSAYHLGLELPVALKLLRTGPKSDKLAQRLQLEARAAARLVHPSIVRVLDIAVSESGDPFVVMELLTGESLASLLERERALPCARAAQLLQPIAEGLALAHARGIVHRDLKPDNVFLSTDGERLQPKLLDFGIAKLEYAALLSRLTDKGTVLGSPNYMSPEQVRGDEVDHRSDIWSFCVMLYKAVSGKAPFNGTDKRAVMDSILQDEPMPLRGLPHLDPELARMIMRGLCKQPAERHASMRELAAELAAWMRARAIPAEMRADAAPSSQPRGPLDVTERLPNVQPIVVTAQVERVKRAPRPFPARHRRWALLTAACLLVVGSSVALTSSTPAPSTPRASAAPLAPVAEVKAEQAVALDDAAAEPSIAAKDTPRPDFESEASIAGVEPTPSKARPPAPRRRVKPSEREPEAPQLPF
jgi:serine/threonine protein kinase